LEKLGKERGMLGVIFRKAQNKVQDPAKLRRLIADLIDKEQWTSLEADVKGDAYEGLLEKNAADVKGGAGQYFTPRPLIQAIVGVTRPAPGQTIHDPACGTGGFLLIAHDYVSQHYELDRSQKKFLKLQKWIASNGPYTGMPQVWWREQSTATPGNTPSTSSSPEFTPTDVTDPFADEV
jgi:type I restriction enzyme M protein